MKKTLGTLLLAGSLTFGANAQEISEQGFNYSKLNSKTEISFENFNYETGKEKSLELGDYLGTNYNQNEKNFSFNSKDCKKIDVFYRTLQGSLVALNTADYVLTMKAIKKGAVEANPFVENIVEKPLLFAGVKAGMTSINLALVDKLYKEGHTKCAKGILIGLNALYSGVVANNIAINIKLNKNK